MGENLLGVGELAATAQSLIGQLLGLQQDVGFGQRGFDRP